MATFQKARAEQAALKLSLYGPPGSGKTLTSLLIAEGLAALSKKRIAYVDTERGTDFYCKDVPARKVHPKAFDFDALYTKSLTEVLEAVKGLSAQTHSVLVLDSISHLWDAAKAAYQGRMTKAGTIPGHAWGKIKAPYKELMHVCINSPLHVLILGRQANDFAEDEETGEMKAAGVKMRAEGETQFEPHVCIRMDPYKDKSKRSHIISAFVEKDRSGVLTGQFIDWPTFDNLAKPLLPFLGTTQAQVQSDEDTAAQDAEALEKAERQKESRSLKVRADFEMKMKKAESREALEVVGKTIAAEKRNLLPVDLEAVRHTYQSNMDRFKGVHYEAVGASANGRQPGEEG